MMDIGFWDCKECGTKNIMGLPVCPQCKKPWPGDEAPAPEGRPAVEEPVTLDPEGGTQEEMTQEPVPPESQANKGRKSGNAKS